MAIKLSIPDQHALKIAKQTMGYGCMAARAIFNTSHADAVAVLKRLGRYQHGPGTHLPKDCACTGPDKENTRRYWQTAFRLGGC